MPTNQGVRHQGRLGERSSPNRGWPLGAHTSRDRSIIGLAVLALAFSLGLVSLRPYVARGDVYAGFSPSTVTVAPGDTFTVYMAILQADGDFNTFDASIRFDPTRLSFVPTSPVSNQRGEVMTSACSNTFQQFDIALDSLKVTLGLLCSSTFVTGPGTIYKAKFVAGPTGGTTTISLGTFTEFYKAGLFVRPQHKQDLTVNIGGPTGVDPLPGSGGRLEFAPPIPNPRHGKGAVLLEFNLPGPDVVSFDVIDLQGRRVAELDSQRYEGGRQRLSWSPPSLANGDYFLRLQTLAHGSATQRWVVLPAGR